MSSQIIQVLIIDHRHGRNVSLHRTIEAASAELLQYVNEWWDHEFPNTPKPAGSEAIDAYFEKHAQEFYSIEQSSLEG